MGVVPIIQLDSGVGLHKWARPVLGASGWAWSGPGWVFLGQDLFWGMGQWACPYNWADKGRGLFWEWSGGHDQEPGKCSGGRDLAGAVLIPGAGLVLGRGF